MSVGPVSAVMTPPGPLIPAPSSYLGPTPGVGEPQPCIRVLHHSQHKQLQATTRNAKQLQATTQFRQVVEYWW